MLLTVTLKQLLSILADGRFHSGTDLALAAGISRSAVWKHLQELPALGIELSAVSGKGYKLQKPLQLLSRPQLLSLLHPDARLLLNELEIIDSIDSTNNHLMKTARAGGESGLVCLAEHQSAGRGRRGRDWVSPFGHNIYLSILWRYQGGPAALSGLSVALGLAVAEALAGFGLNPVGLKWPNDIFYADRKLAGILVEVTGESSGPCHAVIGLGLNFYLPTRQAGQIGQPWIDLQSILGEGIYCRRNELIAILLNHLLPVIAGYQPESLGGYVQEWRKFDVMLGKQVQLFVGDICYPGEVAGITDEGLLLLKDSSGHSRAFASGEVSFKNS